MKQLGLFGMVGAGAMALHWAVVALLVPLGVLPLWANPAGFLVAFQLSYSGHRHLTFQATDLPHSSTLPRFFGVALGAFLLNQLLYALLLHFTTLDYRLALALVLVLVAAMTFISSQRWAFR